MLAQLGWKFLWRVRGVDCHYLEEQFPQRLLEDFGGGIFVGCRPRRI
ncbi:MAG: hypothetical protein ACYSP9_00590 [Planctomycetota bacterium]